MRAPRAVRGFSLIEVLVAFSIMAVSLGVLYQSLGGSARALGEADRQSRAVLLAESMLALYASVPPEGLAQQGHFEGYDWRLFTEPVADVPERPDLWRLHQLVVEVAWADGARARSFRLVSVRPEVAADELPAPVLEAR